MILTVPEMQVLRSLLRRFGLDATSFKGRLSLDWNEKGPCKIEILHREPLDVTHEKDTHGR